MKEIFFIFPTGILGKSKYLLDGASPDINRGPDRLITVSTITPVQYHCTLPYLVYFASSVVHRLARLGLPTSPPIQIITYDDPEEVFVWLQTCLRLYTPEFSVSKACADSIE